MRSSLARRIFTTTLTIMIVGPLTSGFTIHRTDSTDQIVADQTSQESVQLQVKDISKRPNDIEDGKNEFTSKAVTVRTISHNIAGPPKEGSDVPEVAITDIKLPPNIEKSKAESLNENGAISPKTEITQDPDENSTVTSAILKIIQRLTDPPIKTDDSTMTTDEFITLNVNQTATDSATNADLSTGKDSTSSESKIDITTYTSDMTIDNVVGERTPELTTIEEIVFRNSKTPEIAETKEEFEGDDTSTVDISTINNNDGEPSVTTVPSWKKYVTIDRKRISSEEITTETVERDQKPSEIAETLAKAPLESSILLQNNDNISSTKTNLQIVTNENKIMEKERIVSSSDADELTSISAIDTKRAGFLDLSKSSSSEPNSTTDKITEMIKLPASLGEAMTTKKTSVAESQSQLTEDAINEELLKEEMIINHKENTIRHQKVQLDDGKQIMEVAPVSKGLHVPTTSTEDSLSVQPISQDRKTTLYTISPNYKPMKKIDVQPPKPFVRDPDDNSWRNESISSLGIVFKPKNATKSFKEVLKNKTETEFFNIPENKDSKNELPDLRVRLEKIAEVRKSKKKKTYKSGEVIYTDYEENISGEAPTTTTTEKMENMIFDLFNSNLSSLDIDTTTPMPFIKIETTTDKMSDDLFKKFDVDTLTTGKSKKYFNAAEYYDTTDEYDAEYVSLPKIELKKFTAPYKTTAPPRERPVFSRYTTKPMSRPHFPERKPTVQYFPPRARTMQNVDIDHYDEDLQKKINYYSSKQKINSKDFFSFTDINDPIATDKPTTTTISPFKYTAYPSERTTKDIYLTTHSRLSSPHGFVLNDENFNRGSYVIKHYKDFLNEAAKTSEFEKIPDFVYPDHPENVNGLTTSPPLDAGDIPPRKTDDYDYETESRKDVLHRFVDNFNQNSERFKMDFPILYNNSIVHQKFDDNGRVASSSAFMKRQYGNEAGTRSSPFSNTRKSCEPHCDLTVELSPAYELHYFVPEQEEKEPPVEMPPTPPPFNFKL